VDWGVVHTVLRTFDRLAVGAGVEVGGGQQQHTQLLARLLQVGARGDAAAAGYFLVAPQDVHEGRAVVEEYNARVERRQQGRGGGGEEENGGGGEAEAPVCGLVKLRPVASKQLLELIHRLLPAAAGAADARGKAEAARE
jgi:hypothetical protein